ncbi:MAG: GNAT family N-acetyltransferase, partial [Rubrivivax sp.]
MAFDFSELTLNLQRTHGRRIALRPVSLSDAWPLFHATRNPLFNKHLLWPQPQQETAVLERMDLIVDAAARGRLSALSAVVKATGEWIGLFRFQPYREDPQTLEMGVWLHDKFWHGRYSLEIGRLCVDAAFSLSAAEHLMGASAPDNFGSCSLMMAVGMAPTDLIRRDAETGVPVLLQEYSIAREQWAQRRSSGPSFEVFRAELEIPTPAARGEPLGESAIAAFCNEARERQPAPGMGEMLALQDKV